MLGLSILLLLFTRVSRVCIAQVLLDGEGFSDVDAKFNGIFDTSGHIFPHGNRLMLPLIWEIL